MNDGTLHFLAGMLLVICFGVGKELMDNYVYGQFNSAEVGWTLLGGIVAGLMWRMKS